ncbi:MAG TPA: SDR family NAD(P)-dependent oxidoreductase [Brevundimonas sp.]|uniref:SDR family NAD(P)-dependent oxidoreductase n=1 Tax=Brevundimonas sp. TaxID=1871086 RepID=UPI002DF46D81|nr:SDR family NAD(P)-dependent oxidoreductase [Brevundimonas sp.]
MNQGVVVITGGQGALGSATADLALQRGWRVALIDHAPGDETAPDELTVGGVDLTDPTQAQAAMDRVAGHFGRIDALLNVAGGFVWQTTEADAPAHEKMFRLNVLTCLNAARAALPHLKRSPEGRIVNVGAAGALKADAGMGAYAASKAGVHRLTEALARELKDTTVTVNAVLPSILDTAQNRADMPDADPEDWVAPGDLAAVMLFLASPESRALRGALIPVTGRV